MPSVHTSSRRSVPPNGSSPGAWRRRPPRTSENNPAQPHAGARDFQSTGPRPDRETVSRHRPTQGVCFRNFRRRCPRLASDGSRGKLRPMTKRIQRLLSFPILAVMLAMVASTQTAAVSLAGLACLSASCIYDRHPIFCAAMRKEIAVIQWNRINASQIPSFS